MPPVASWASSRRPSMAMIRGPPPGRSDRLYTETLIRLERGFLCHAAPPDLLPIVPAPCRGAKYVTFGSFNNPSKVSEGALAAWSRLRLAVSGSRLAVK